MIGSNNQQTCFAIRYKDVYFSQMFISAKDAFKDFNGFGTFYQFCFIHFKGINELRPDTQDIVRARTTEKLKNFSMVKLRLENIRSHWPTLSAYRVIFMETIIKTMDLEDPTYFKYLLSL